MDSYVVKVERSGTIRRLTLGVSPDQFSFDQLQSRIGKLFLLPVDAQIVLTYTDRDGDVVTMAGDEDLKDALVLQKLNPLKVTVNLGGGRDDVKASTAPAQEQLKPVEVPVANKAEEKAATAADGAATESTSAADSTPAVVAADATDQSSQEAPKATGNGFPSVIMQARRNDKDRQIHSGIRCDGCGMVPIQGPRFKSCVKPNYDLCLKCFEGSGAGENEYIKIDRLFHRVGYPAYVGRMREMQKMQEGLSRQREEEKKSTVNADLEKSAPAPAEENPAPASTEGGDKPAVEGNSDVAVHEGVQCDECGVVPIQGNRYKSTVRFNYDVCQSCFVKGGSNSSEYTCVEKPQPQFVGGHPLMMRGPHGPHFRRGPRGFMGRQCPGRFLWALNQLASGEAGAEPATLEIPTLVGNLSLKVSVEGAPESQAEAAAAAPENTSTSVPKGESDSSPLFARPEGEEGTEVLFKDSAPVPEKAVKESVDVPADNSAPLFAKPAEENSEVQPPVEVEKSAAVVDSDVNTEEKVVGGEETPAQAPPVAEDLSSKEGLLGKLAAMGFVDAKLNEELLEKNSFDLRKTLDDLCAAEEWDPILGELQEMGFYDANMNRRLMFKNNGSVKRVVKELVQMYKGEKLA